MARCGSCNKFCATTDEGGESVDDLSVEVDASAATSWQPGDPSFVKIRAEVSVDRTSECCGDSVAEGHSNDAEDDLADDDVLVAIRDHLATTLADDEEHDVEIEEEGVSLNERTHGRNKTVVALVEWRIHCCGTKLGEGTLEAEIDFEEC